MPVQSSGDKLPDTSKTGTVTTNNNENFENSDYQTFFKEKAVPFMSKLEVTIEDELVEKKSGIVHTNEPGFGRKCLFLKEGSRLKLSFGELIQSVRIRFKATGGKKVALVTGIRDEYTLFTFDISSPRTDTKITAGDFDHLIISGFSNDKLTTGDLYLDDIEWSTSSESA